VFYTSFRGFYSKFIGINKKIPRVEVESPETKSKSFRNSIKIRFFMFSKRILLRLLNALDIDGALLLNTSIPKGVNFSEYDYIISSSDPVAAHKIAMKIVKRWKDKNNKLKWIQYWGDPLFTASFNSGEIYKKFMAYIIERKLIKNGDLIVYASPLTLNEQKSTFRFFANKMTFSHQVAEFGKSDFERQSSSDKSSRRRIRVGYFGDYMKDNRNIEPFYNAARYFPDIEFYIVGNSDIKLEPLENLVLIKQRLSYGKIKYLEENCDILFAVTNKIGTAIPAKIYYWTGYLSKPIIVALDGPFKDELEHYFSNFERYIVCENNEEDIIKALQDAIKQVKSGIVCKLTPELTEKFMVQRILNSI